MPTYSPLSCVAGERLGVRVSALPKAGVALGDRPGLKAGAERDKAAEADW
jgi:hypothetical protein